MFVLCYNAELINLCASSVVLAVWIALEVLLHQYVGFTWEGDGWYRPQYAGSKTHGTRGAIPLSSSNEGGDPKW